MSYPLRLPPELDVEAREQCQRLGISLNAFIAVALDAYLRSGGRPGGRRQHPAGSSAVTRKRPVKGKADGAGPRGLGQAIEGSHPDPANWRNWNSPDMWPYVDPEFAHRFEGLGDTDDAAAVALEIEYWATRERPVA